MENLILNQQNHLPKVEFFADGRFSLEGKAIPEDANKLFDPLIDYSSQLAVDHLVFNVKLEYFNTASSKKILELLRTIDANQKIKKVLIHWHFEEGDEECVETAEIYEELLLRSEFRYHEYPEVA